MTQVKREYVVEVGSAEYIPNFRGEEVLTQVKWDFYKAFNLESDAKDFAERNAEDVEYIRWGVKKWN